MTQEHPIAPSSELVEKWYEAIDNSSTSWKQELTTQAARWGADMELEACCEWIPKATPWDAEQLRAARRPKPPSLKELALEALDQADKGLTEYEWPSRHDIIRRALESLPD